jgi:IclR family acetate operon transcriptional repressor
MTDADTGSTQRLQSVGHAFEIIEYLRKDGPATLSDIAAEFDMPMSTTHVYMSTLLESEYVVKPDDVYKCSLRFLWMGGYLRNGIPLYHAAKTEADSLQEDIGEYANVGTDQSGYMIQLYKSENPDSIDDRASLGAHLHLHTTAIGKAILSEWSSDEFDEHVRQFGLPQQTENTITDRAALEAELEDVRERGYAVNDAEHYDGVRAVAVPITGNDGAVVGGISVSGPLSRIGTDRIEADIAPKLFEKRNIIELKL